MRMQRKGIDILQALLALNCCNSITFFPCIRGVSIVLCTFDYNIYCI